MALANEPFTEHDMSMSLKLSVSQALSYLDAHEVDCWASFIGFGSDSESLREASHSSLASSTPLYAIGYLSQHARNTSQHFATRDWLS